MWKTETWIYTYSYRRNDGKMCTKVSTPVSHQLIVSVLALHQTVLSKNYSVTIETILVAGQIIVRTILGLEFFLFAFTSVVSKCVNVWGSWRSKMDSLFYSIRCCFLFQPQTRDSDTRFKGTRASTTKVIIYKEKCPVFFVMYRNVWHFLSLVSAFDMLKTG